MSEDIQDNAELPQIEPMEATLARVQKSGRMSEDDVRKEAERLGYRGTHVMPYGFPFKVGLSGNDPVPDKAEEVKDKTEGVSVEKVPESALKQ